MCQCWPSFGKSSKSCPKPWGNITNDLDEVCIRQPNSNMFFHTLKEIIVFQTLSCLVHLQMLGEILREKIQVHQVYQQKRRFGAFSLLCEVTTEIITLETVCRYLPVFFCWGRCDCVHRFKLILNFFSRGLTKTGYNFHCFSKSQVNPRQLIIYVYVIT